MRVEERGGSPRSSIEWDDELREKEDELDPVLVFREALRGCAAAGSLGALDEVVRGAGMRSAK
ncbi:MAG: hypothetical protein IT535_05150 [Bauldia sp.]|nr:hypothetical protein [Bauldia sp.]